MKRLLLASLLFASITSLSVSAFAAGGGGDVASEFWVHWGWSMVNFAIFAAVLWKFALPKLQEYFADRRTSLMSELDEARRLRAEAQEKLDEYSSRLDSLDAERQELMDDYHAQGRRERDRLVADASKQVEKMRADAEVLIAAETRRAIAGIEQQAVNLAVDMATERVKKQMDDATQNALVDRYVGEMKEIV